MHAFRMITGGEMNGFLVVYYLSALQDPQRCGVGCKEHAAGHHNPGRDRLALVLPPGKNFIPRMVQLPVGTQTIHIDMSDKPVLHGRQEDLLAFAERLDKNQRVVNDKWGKPVDLQVKLSSYDSACINIGRKLRDQDIVEQNPTNLNEFKFKPVYAAAMDYGLAALAMATAVQDAHEAEKIRVRNEQASAAALKELLKIGGLL